MTIKNLSPIGSIACGTTAGPCFLRAVINIKTFRQADIQAEIQTSRQPGRYIDRTDGIHTVIQSDIYTSRETYSQTDRQTDSHTYIHTDRQAGRQRDIHTYRQDTHTYRQTDRQKDRYTEKHTYIHT